MHCTWAPSGAVVLTDLAAEDYTVGSTSHGLPGSSAHMGPSLLSQERVG